jgi:RNA polymerase sigma-70 factor (ECF subfamily)
MAERPGRLEHNSPAGRAPQGVAAGSGAPLTSTIGEAVCGCDLEAPAELYDQHATRVFSLAMRIVREPGAAEDVVQEVFLHACTQRHRYDPTRGSVSTWLLMLTRSRALDRIRVSRRDGSRRIASCDYASLAAPASPDADDTRAIRDALLMLAPEERHPLELAFYEGYTHSEIAALLKQPLGTVKTRIRRAILILRTAIKLPLPPGSEDSSHAPSGPSGHLLIALPGQMIEGNSAGDEGRED